MPGLSTRPIMLTREQSTFRLAFPYDVRLVDFARSLFYATFDKESSSWTVAACAQNLDALRRAYHEGLIDVPPDSLVSPGEELEVAPAALLRPGSLGRPFLVAMGQRDETLYAKLRSIPGSLWEKKAGAMSYPASASVALAELVDRGLVSDPSGLLSPAAVVVAFDARTGRFTVRGDERAAAAFAQYFPGRDVVTAWRERGLDVAFDGAFSEEVYRGELARVGPGVQPEGLQATLYPFQAQAVAVALERSGFGVFDSPGLGKTLIAIATGYERLVHRRDITRVLCVVPGTARSQWAEEITRFTGHEDVVVVAGDVKHRTALYERALEARWAVVNYDLLHRDAKFIAPLASGLVIADEAQRIKSYEASRTKALRRLGQRAQARLALTGTPVENEPSEWYSILSGYAIPNLFGSPQDYLGRYQYPGRFGGYEGARRLPELRERSRPHYIRHTKAEVAQHLPPLRPYVIRLDPDPAYAAALRRVHREAKDEIKRAALERQKGRRSSDADPDVEIQTAAEMTAVGMLKLLCISPRLVAGSDAVSADVLRRAGLVPDEDGPKIDYLRTRIAEYHAAHERVIVFCYSDKAIDLVARRLDEDRIPYVLYTGNENHREREESRRRFTSAPTDEDPGPSVLLSTDAGAEALNLGAYCSTVINLDIPWKATTMEQRGNRVHRIDGTAQSYEVINLVLSGTIERGLLAVVERKADLQDAILGERGGRSRTTGGRGRNLFTDVMAAYDDEADAAA